MLAEEIVQTSETTMSLKSFTETVVSKCLVKNSEEAIRIGMIRVSIASLRAEECVGLTVAIMARTCLIEIL